MNIILENAEYRKNGEKCGRCRRQPAIACGYAGFCERGLSCDKDSMTSDGLGKCVSLPSKLNYSKLVRHTSKNKLIYMIILVI